METLHTRIKKRPSEKSPRKEIKRILLIDHQANSALSTALAREGYQVVLCDCVQKAWNFLYPQRPNLIIFGLHDCEGRALSDLHECRALAGSVPMVLATSVPVSPALLKSLPLGAAAVTADFSAPEIAIEMLRNLESWTAKR